MGDVGPFDEQWWHRAAVRRLILPGTIMGRVCSSSSPPLKHGATLAAGARAQKRRMRRRVREKRR
eukprot:1898834-Pyramimonas_sp.AAC.1